MSGCFEIRASVVAQLVKINVPAAIPYVSARERIRRCIRPRSYLRYTESMNTGWLIQHSVPGNVSLDAGSSRSSDFVSPRVDHRSLQCALRLLHATGIAGVVAT